MQTIPYIGVHNNFFHCYQYSSFFAGWLSFLCHLLKLVDIVSECHFVLAASRTLYLVCVLQLLDPFGLLRLKLCNLLFNFLTPGVLSVDALDEFHPLRLPLHLLLVVPLGDRIHLLTPDHVLHLRVVHAFGVLLQSNHFLMLLPLVLQSQSLSLRLLQHRLSVSQDVVITLLLEVVVLSRQVCKLLLLLPLIARLVVVVVVVALTDFKDILSLLFCLFNFFPSLVVVDTCDFKHI